MQRRTADRDARRNQRVTETRSKSQSVTRRGDAGESAKRAANSEQSKQSQSRIRNETTRQQASDRDATRRTQQSAGSNATTNRQAHLNNEQRAQFRQTLFTQQASHRVTRANFTVAVGRRIPRRVRLYAIPAALLAIVPAYYRSYRYVWVEDRICIVDPSTYDIVDVIDDTGTGYGTSDQIATLELSPGERQAVLGLLRADAPRADIKIGLALGAEIPPVISLSRFPDELIAEIQRLDRYRYVLVDDSVVIVNPNNRVVVLVVRA